MHELRQIASAKKGHFRTVIAVRPSYQIHETSGFEHENTIAILSEKSVSIDQSLFLLSLRKTFGYHQRVTFKTGAANFDACILPYLTKADSLLSWDSGEGISHFQHTTGTIRKI